MVVTAFIGSCPPKASTVQAHAGAGEEPCTTSCKSSPELQCMAGGGCSASTSAPTLRQEVTQRGGTKQADLDFPGYGQGGGCLAATSSMVPS